MKNFWKGFLTALGTLAATGVVTLLILLIPSVREWVTRQVSGHGTFGKTELTILLAVLCVVLFLLLIRSRIAYRGLQKRAREGSLTIGDLADMKDLMKATDVETVLRGGHG